MDPSKAFSWAPSHVQPKDVATMKQRKELVPTIMAASRISWKMGTFKSFPPSSTCFSSYVPPMTNHGGTEGIENRSINKQTTKSWTEISRRNNLACSKFGEIYCLVCGWTNPFDKHDCQIGSSPRVQGENKKYLKPPPSCFVSFLQSQSLLLKKNSPKLHWIKVPPGRHLIVPSLQSLLIKHGTK